MENAVRNQATKDNEPGTEPESLCRDTRGLSSVEYLILLVVIVVGVIATWQKIGDKIKSKTTEANTQIQKL